MKHFKTFDEGLDLSHISLLTENLQLRVEALESNTQGVLAGLESGWHTYSNTRHRYNRACDELKKTLIGMKESLKDPTDTFDIVVMTQATQYSAKVQAELYQYEQGVVHDLNEINSKVAVLSDEVVCSSHLVLPIKHGIQGNHAEVPLSVGEDLKTADKPVL